MIIALFIEGVIIANRKFSPGIRANSQSIVKQEDMDFSLREERWELSPLFNILKRVMPVL